MMDKKANVKHMSIQCASAQLGFTLIEVLVALAIFSVAAVAASSASSSYINAVDRLRTKTLAHFVAQNKAADMRMQGQWQTGESTQSVSEQGREWKIVTKALPTASKKIRRLEITVSQVVNEQATPVHDLVVFLKKPS